MDLEEARNRLARLINEPDLLRKKLVALGIISARLRPAGIEPVLVGGTAVEFYTAGGYASKDVDLALPSIELVDEVFAELAFIKEGRYWVREDLDILFEAPAGDLAGEDAPRRIIEVDGLRVTILGIEDLVIDRLRAWIHWKSEEDGRWTRRLATLYRDSIDWRYMREKLKANEEERLALDVLVNELGIQ